MSMMRREGTVQEDDGINHVVVLMFENRSFDHLIGDCPKIRNAAPLTGFNEYDGRQYPQAPGAARVIAHDPMHETPDVMVQLGPNGGVQVNGGFVLDYSHSYHDISNADRAEIMKYHADGTMPALHTLVQEFTVCDHWFSSVPGPTWVNRLFALSGTSLGRVKMPNGIMNLNIHWYDQPTIFDRLNEKKLSWKVYFGNTPLSFLFVHQWEPQNATRHHHMTKFYEDAAGEPDQFPDFAFIEPAYMEPGANDAHPPHDILETDAFIANVYNAIRANEKLWESTLLVILCDEHGGFYDHVSPPAAVPPDHHQEEYTFDRYGVRVPAVLVSPRVSNTIFSSVLDHTSLLKYLKDKWGLGFLGNRTEAAQTFKDAIQSALRPTAASLPYPQNVSKIVAAPRDALSDHQAAIVAMSHNLESMTAEDPNVVAARSRHLLTGPQSQIDAAFDRVESFLSQQAAKLLGNGATGP